MPRRPRARVPVGFPPSAPPARPDDGVGCALAVIAVVVLCALFSWCGGEAKAQHRPRQPHRIAAPVPACEWTPEARDWLLRMVQVETAHAAERRETIPWVLARRWRARGPALRGQTFAGAVVAFSSVLRRLQAELDSGASLDDAAALAGASPWQRRALASTSQSVPDLAADLDRWAAGEVPGDGCAWSARGPAFNWRAPLPGDAQDARLLSCPGFNAYFPPSHDQLAALERASEEACP